MTDDVSMAVWRTAPAPSISLVQKQWLFRPGALTCGLRQLGTVRLQVLREYAWGALPEDARLLRCAAGTPLWLREVHMTIDGIPGVVARSFTPLRASHGRWQGIRRLRSRPLADMLYHDPRIERSVFRVARLPWHHPLARTVDLVQSTDSLSRRLHARCSVFWFDHQPLVVSECFLPSFWRKAQTGR